MSRIFDVLLEKSGTYTVNSVCGQERFMLRLYGVAGPNQVILPDYKNPQEQETLVWSTGVTARKVDSDLDTIARESHGMQVLAHNIGHASNDLQVVKSNLRQYIEADSIYCMSPQMLQLIPAPVTNSNKATYYLYLRATAPRMDYVEVSLGSGITMHINGEFDYYCRERSAINLVARIPARSLFRASYSQILPVKDTILRVLTKAQYGQS